jgi:hypothetical protein
MHCNSYIPLFQPASNTWMIQPIYPFYLVSQGDGHKACGRRGWSETRRLKKKQKDTKTRIVKNGKIPFRVVGGDVARENEISWQVLS